MNVWLPLTCPLLETWPATQACALSGNQTGNPLVHRPMISLLSYTSQSHYWRLLTELFILLPYELAVTLLGIYSDELKTHVHTKPVHGCL